MVYIFTSSTRSKSTNEIILPLAGMVTVQALVGIMQVLQQHSIGWQSLGELELDPAWSGVSIVWANGVRSLRAYGLSDHPNILGGCFAFGLILLATWFIQTDSTRRTLIGAVFALGTIGLFLTFSRAAWLATTLGVAWIVMFLYRTRTDPRSSRHSCPSGCGIPHRPALRLALDRFRGSSVGRAGFVQPRGD